MALHFNNLSKKPVKYAVILMFLCIGIPCFGILLFHNAQKSTQTLHQKPNIILVSIDTIRPDHMSVYGYAKPTTPNLDTWSKNALVFTNAFTTVPTTYPSLIGLLTGADPLITHAIGNGSIPIPSTVATLPTLLRNVGYTTAGFISNPFLDFTVGPDGGFASTHVRDGFDVWKTVEFLRDKNRYAEGNTEYKTIYESFFSEALSWIGKTHEQPFFFWIHLMDPHAPYVPDETHRCIFDVQQCEKTVRSKYFDLEKRRRILQGCNQVNDEELRQYQSLYDGGIADVDEKLGKLFQTLETQRLDTNTIVVIYGDHGEGFDHAHYFSHGDTLYNSNIHIPLIIRNPFSSVIGKNDQLIDNTDIAPTLLNLASIGIPNTITGISFDGVFTVSTSVSAKTRVYAITPDLSQISVIDGSYKYISYLQNPCRYNLLSEELFDIQTDMQESTNILPKQASYASYLKQDLFSHFTAQKLSDEVNRKFGSGTEAKLNRLKSLGY